MPNSEAAASPPTATASCDYGVVHMDSINPVGGLAAARLRLVEIWADPQIRAFARRYAGDRQVADDALQSVYLAMDRLEHLDEITNLKAYFRRVLVRAIVRERVQLGALLVDDFPRVAEAHESVAKSLRGSQAGFEERGLHLSAGPILAQAARRRARCAHGRAASPLG